MGHIGNAIGTRLATQKITNRNFLVVKTYTYKKNIQNYYLINLICYHLFFNYSISETVFGEVRSNKAIEQKNRGLQEMLIPNALLNNNIIYQKTKISEEKTTIMQNEFLDISLTNDKIEELKDFKKSDLSYLLPNKNKRYLAKTLQNYIEAEKKKKTNARNNVKKKKVHRNINFMAEKTHKCLFDCILSYTKNNAKKETKMLNDDITEIKKYRTYTLNHIEEQIKDIKYHLTQYKECYNIVQEEIVVHKKILQLFKSKKTRLSLCERQDKVILDVLAKQDLIKKLITSCLAKKKEFVACWKSIKYCNKTTLNRNKSHISFLFKRIKNNCKKQNNSFTHFRKNVQKNYYDLALNYFNTLKKR